MTHTPADPLQYKAPARHFFAGQVQHGLLAAVLYCTEEPDMRLLYPANQ